MAETNAQWVVVVNDEEQYSIWESDRDAPQGWRTVGAEGSKEDCLARIELLWTDMRPKSLRDRIAEHQNTAAGR